MNTEIYLDTNATTPVWPGAAQAALQTMQEGFGNPSSAHSTGLRARARLAAARASAQRVLGAGEGHIVFTSGATEAIQTAVLSALCDVRERRARGEVTGSLLVYGATEHKAVPESLAHWNTVLGLGLRLQALAVDAEGRHDLRQLRALAPQAGLVCTMAANNETGAVSDLPGIEAVMREAGRDALWLVDGVQALGKLRLALSASRIDYAAFSGHKLYAPKGIGMLYVREGAPFTPLMAGGGQEAGQRSGTENMAGIAALGAVLDALEKGQTFQAPARMAAWRDRLVGSLRDAFPGIVFNTPLAHALPTTLNFSVEGFSSKELLDVFDAVGVRVSAGSACSAARAAPSHVLQAMDLPAWRVASAVRLSFGPLADEAFIQEACVRIAAAGQAIRVGHLAQSGVAAPQADGVVQLAGGERCSWLLLDAGSRGGVLLYPQEELAARVQQTLRGLNYTLRAQFGLDTAAPADGPAQHRVGLADGSEASALPLGEQVLVHVRRDGHEAFLFGPLHEGRLRAGDVRFVFGSAAAGAAAWRGIAGPQAVWCPDCDPQDRVATLQSPAQAGDERSWTLRPGGLEALLREHPDAILVDVREPAEFHAAPQRDMAGRKTVNLPLSRLADRLAELLREPEQIMVFVCRSGARSTRAARCLRQSGHRNAWHLAGGLALAGES